MLGISVATSLSPFTSSFSVCLVAVAGAALSLNFSDLATPSRVRICATQPSQARGAATLAIRRFPMACAPAALRSPASSSLAPPFGGGGGGASVHERVSVKCTHWRTLPSHHVGCRAVMSAENRDVDLASSELEKGELSQHLGGEKLRHVGRGSRLVGSGSAVPKLVISNEDLSKYVDTSDEWISVRTGIRNRRVLGDETVTSLSVEASRKALEMANVKPEEVDLLLLCTSTPDDLFGSAPQVQALLGCHNALAFDLTAACSGFVLGLVTATRFIRGGGYKNVLVVGADALSKYVDWTDRGTCILFGDASGALVLQAATDDQDSLLGFDLRSDGNGHKHLHATVDNIEDPSSSSGEETNGSTFKVPGRASYECIQMNGKEVFKFAVRAVPQVVQGALQEAGLTGENIDWLLLHQANQRILDSVADRLHIPAEKVISNLANYGNTSAASIPLALDEAVRSGKVKAGDVVATAGFGAGLTWGSAIIRWG